MEAFPLLFFLCWFVAFPSLLSSVSDNIVYYLVDILDRGDLYLNVEKVSLLSYQGHALVCFLQHRWRIFELNLHNTQMK